MLIEKLKSVFFSRSEWKINKKLFKIILFFGICFAIGDLLNFLVIANNDFKMPVFSEKIIPNEKTHTKGEAGTKLKILADWIDLNDVVLVHKKIKNLSEKNYLFRKAMKIIRYPHNCNGIASPGDIVRWLSLFFVLFLVPLLITLLIIEKICVFMKT